MVADNQTLRNYFYKHFLFEEIVANICPNYTKINLAIHQYKSE